MQHTTPQTENIDNYWECEPMTCVPYLDTSCSIKQGKIILDLYKKPKDRNLYLLPESCHLAIRITRICTENDTRDQRHSELNNWLLERHFLPGIINGAIEKAKSIRRSVAIRKGARDTAQSRIPVFAVSWDPRLPSVSAINHNTGEV